MWPADRDGGADTYGASSTEAGAASVTMSWSTAGSGTGEWAMGAASLKPAIAGTPSISGLAGDTLRYTAGGGPIVIEQGGNARRHRQPTRRTSTPAR